MMNYSVARWEPLENGRYAARSYEVGVYTEFDSDTPISTWKNPITGENREVFWFVSGPVNITLGPDGIETGENAIANLFLA